MKLTNMSLVGRHLFPPPDPGLNIRSSRTTIANHQVPTISSQNPNTKPVLLSNLLSLALTVTLTSPLPSLAIPSVNSQSPLLPPTTPFSQSKNLQVGLQDGYEF